MADLEHDCKFGYSGFSIQISQSETIQNLLASDIGELEVPSKSESGQGATLLFT